MADLTIRGLDDGIVERYRELAERRGVPLDRVLCEVLTAAAPAEQLTIEEKLALADRIRAMAPKGVVQTDSTEIIRRMRDGS